MNLDSSTLSSDYRPPALLMGHGPTSAFDPDQAYGQSELFAIDRHPRVLRRGESVSRDYPVVISFEPSSTRTNYLVSPIDLWSRLNDELAAKEKQAREAYHAYWIRIESLISDAVLDGFTLNRESERDFWSFVKSVPFACKAELVLVDNGHLRAVWAGEDGSHLGLQFLGGRMLQYVIFRRRKGSSHISRVAGRDTFQGVKRQMQIFDLEALLKT